MSDEKDKDQQQLLYRPDIEYQDTYESEHKNKGYGTVISGDRSDEEEGKDIIDSITNTFNEVTKMMPLLPVDLQTVINGVYKPVLDNWASFPKKSYPKTIPEKGKPGWGGGGGDSGGGYIPEIIYPIPPDIPEPEPDPGGENPYEVDPTGMWDIVVPMTVTFPIVSDTEIIEKEYIKNVADLFDYYVNRLKNIISHYQAEKISAIYARKINDDGNLSSKTLPEISFMLTQISDTCASVEDKSKHLFDSGVAMGEKTKLKLNFLANVCPVEQTLLHLKNFNAVYKLRLRYSEIDTEKESNKIYAMSNNILRALQEGYDMKYDTAYADLYKYLNSSLDILEDVVNTDLAGLRAKRTLIEKGGIKK